jgi:hypothetical protein
MPPRGSEASSAPSGSLSRTHPLIPSLSGRGREIIPYTPLVIAPSDALPTSLAYLR